jgi:hypothetical protein
LIGKHVLIRSDRRNSRVVRQLALKGDGGHDLRPMMQPSQAQDTQHLGKILAMDIQPIRDWSRITCLAVEL